MRQKLLTSAQPLRRAIQTQTVLRSNPCAACILPQPLPLLLPSWVFPDFIVT
eukprot:m.273974 g.273974  ORF g.273974 m.273974 type:complete len:52 (+) comp11090_c1_seq49:123-278(+)